MRLDAPTNGRVKKHGPLVCEASLSGVCARLKPKPRLRRAARPKPRPRLRGTSNRDAIRSTKNRRSDIGPLLFEFTTRTNHPARSADRRLLEQRQLNTGIR